MLYLKNQEKYTDWSNWSKTDIEFENYLKKEYEINDNHFNFLKNSYESTSINNEQKAEIETLRKAFNIPILKGKLNRELLKIKKSEMNDSDLIKTLSELYLHYELQNQVKQNEEENKSPRILYSKYVSG